MKPRPSGAGSFMQLQMRCPEGHLMKPRKQDQMAHAFSLPVSVCRACPRFQQCLSESEIRQRNRGKRVRVCVHQGIYDRVLEQEQKPEFKQKLRERMWKMEGLFAEAKSHHGLRRARYRRRWKVQVQVYVISTLQNLKRLAEAVIFILSSIQTTMMDLLFRPSKLELQWQLT